jgi:hypothetical protein
MLATARDRIAATVGNGMTEEEALAAKPFADLVQAVVTAMIKDVARRHSK